MWIERFESSVLPNIEHPPPNADWRLTTDN
jgi:hypothetical protein